jgi:hypothetical protein
VLDLHPSSLAGFPCPAGGTGGEPTVRKPAQQVLDNSPLDETPYGAESVTSTSSDPLAVVTDGVDRTDLGGPS